MSFAFYCFISFILHMLICAGCVILSLVTLSKIFFPKLDCFSGSPAKDFPSLILFSHSPLLSLSLSLSLSLPSGHSTPSPTSLSPSATVFTWPLHVTWSWARTPRMPTSVPPLFQTLLNFKQNKRRGKEGVGRRRRRRKRKSEHVGPGECATTSESHSFTHPLSVHLCRSDLRFNSCTHPPLFTVWKPSSLSLPVFCLLWTGLIVALTTDLGSDYFVACPSVGLKDNTLCSCLHGQLPSQLPKGNFCPSDAF